MNTVCQQQNRKLCELVVALLLQHLGANYVGNEKIKKNTITCYINIPAAPGEQHPMPKQKT